MKLITKSVIDEWCDEMAECATVCDLRGDELQAFLANWLKGELIEGYESKECPECGSPNLLECDDGSSFNCPNCKIDFEVSP